MIRASGTWCTSHWQHWGDTWAMIELRLSTSIQNHPKWGIAGKSWNKWENLFLFVCGKELWNKGHWPIWQRKQWPRPRKYLLEYQLECNWQKCSCWDTKNIKLHAVESVAFLLDQRRLLTSLSRMTLQSNLLRDDVLTRGRWNGCLLLVPNSALWFQMVWR